MFYNVDGVENTIQFFFGDSWYTDYSSFLTGQLSIENMQALEESEVVQFKKDDLYKLYKSSLLYSNTTLDHSTKLKIKLLMCLLVQN